MPPVIHCDGTPLETIDDVTHAYQEEEAISSQNDVTTNVTVNPLDGVDQQVRVQVLLVENEIQQQVRVQLLLKRLYVWKAQI